MVKSLLSRVFGQNMGWFSGKASAKAQKFPFGFSSKFDLLQTLNMTLPDIQLIKLSIDSKLEDKAFEQFLTYMKTRSTPVCNWTKRGDILHTLREVYPETISSLMKAADNILQHQFLLFAKHRVQAGKMISWSANYENDIQPDTELWRPDKTFSRSQLITDTSGDIQFVWNLNRHQHFLDLGKAYWYTGEEEFVQEFIAEVTSWIEQNPYHHGVNWVDNYEIALRGLFWILGAMFFLNSANINETFFCQFYRTLLLHGHAVAECLQTGSKTMEPLHIIASATFLYVLGTVFPEYIESKAWTKSGWEILQADTKVFTLDQILQEPLAALVNAIELYCFAFIIRKNSRLHIPQKIVEGLTTMLEHLSLFMKPNGALTRMGEQSPLQLLRGMYGQGDNFHYLFAMAAVLLKNDRFKQPGSAFEESLLWFFCTEGYQDFQKMEAQPRPQHSYLAPNGAYAVMRSSWMPDSGYCIIANHALKTKRRHLLPHSDLLSVEVYANGHEILMDSGPYSTQEHDEWSDYFCSVQAHNAITVDHIKHFNFADRHVRGEFDQWVSTPLFDFLSGYHTGLEDLEQPITYRRSIFYCKPNYWLLCDVLTGEGQHVFDQYFHFAPLRLNVDFSNKGVNVKVGDRRYFALLPVGTEDTDVMIFTGGDTPDSGWMSDGYKHRMEAPFIKYGKQTQAPATFITLLYAYEADQMIKIEGRLLRPSLQGAPLLSHEAVAVELKIGQEIHYFALRYKECAAIQFENMTFHGAFMFLRRAADGQMELHLHHATLLKIGDQTVFESDSPVDAFTLRLVDETLHVLCTGNYTFRTQLPQIKNLLVNERKGFLKQQNDVSIITTSRI